MARALALPAALLMAFTAGVAAQPRFPAKPIRIVVPFSPGGATDTLTRLIAQKMGENWGQPVVIDNRSGAGGTLGTAMAAKATPDGHTLLTSSSAFVINAALHQHLPYDPLRDFAGVTQIGISKSTLLVTSALGVKSLKEFIDLAHTGRIAREVTPRPAKSGSAYRPSHSARNRC
jgi:tripartite-type tricarboxylate transporter receptor subunit TctC